MKIELFPCAGGFAEGFRRAGVVFDVAVDADPDACASYAHNLHHAPLQMDIRSLLMLVRQGWKPGRVDFLLADPPCTPWSRAGKRKGTDDKRDVLRETCELVELLQPDCWLIANVPGLDDGPNLKKVQASIGALEGYCVDFARLDAADYGVPQHRIRPFWFGHRPNTPHLTWPKPTHGDPAHIGHAVLGDDREPWRTCRQALEHLPLAELGKPARMRMRACNGKQHGSVGDRPARVVGTSNLSDGNVLVARGGHSGHPAAMADSPSPTVRGGGDGHSAPQLVLAPSEPARRRSRPFHNGHPASTPDEPAHTITARDGGGEHSAATTLLLGNEKHRPNTPDEPSNCITTKGDGRGAQGAAVMLVEGNGRGHVPQDPDLPSSTITTPQPGPRSRKALTWPWDRPSVAVSTQSFLDEPGHHGPKRRNPYTNANCIVLSEKAAAILQGFPESWVFHGKTKKTRWSQIGQAMPPPLAEAVARQIARRLCPQPEGSQ